MKYPKLYSLTATGAIQEWQIYIEGDGYFTISGQVDGKKVTSAPTRCTGKNIGKANETSPEEQARIEAAAKWTKKVDAGYVRDIDLVGGDELRLDPMLAKNYDDYNDHSYLVASQPKLDGLRCVITKQNAYSRLWKPFSTLQHIRDELAQVFKKFPNILGFDGEMYSHNLKYEFEKIVSIVKKQNVSEFDLERCKKVVKYHIYDIITSDELTFEKRNTLVGMVFNRFKFQYLERVETTIVNSIGKLDDLYEQYIRQGYEGQMVRNLSSLYQHKRTKDLLKRKVFKDDEFLIIGVNEGKGNREGCAVLRLETKNRMHFDSVPIGSVDYLKRLWCRRKELVGLYATVKYQNLTADGVPRFNNTTKIRTANLEEFIV